MSEFPKDIYTEPENVDVDTLANLGPLAAMAGAWEGVRGTDVNPKPEGPRTAAFIEHIDLEPIDPQANGPQLLYGLRYHTHIVQPGEVETYHDQVGYWLYEPLHRNGDPYAGDSARPGGARRRQRRAGRQELRSQGRTRLHGERHLLGTLFGVRLQDHGIQDQRHGEPGWNLVL